MSSPNATTTTTTQQPVSVVEVLASDLQGGGVVFCPNPKMALWSAHPKVYVDLSHDGQGKCPYCGTLYRLKAGEKISHGH